MKRYFLFHYTLQKPSDKKTILHAIKTNNYTLISESTLSQGDLEIVVEIEEQELQSFLLQDPQLRFLSSYKELSLEVDWNKQAELFCKHYEKGLIEVQLKNTKSFHLLPGNAFGDTSHPTTELILTLLDRYVKDQIVFDIGTGSAILAIASILQGAKHVWAFEIDEKALLCAKKNIEFNHLELHISLQKEACLPHIEKEQSMPLVILANMITGELEKVLIAYKNYFQHPGFFLFSGILKKEKMIMKKKLLALDIEVLEEHEKEGWVCFVCTYKPLFVNQ